MRILTAEAAALDGCLCHHPGDDMKQTMIHLGMMIALLLLSCAVMAQTRSGDRPQFVDLHGRRPPPSYSSTVYVAGGWGTVQGLRVELGGNFGSYFKFGLLYSTLDSWSHSEYEQFGVLAGVHFPASPDMTPFLLLSYGGSGHLWGNADTYVMGGLGMLIHLNDLVSLRPELVIASTTRFKEGEWHNGYFGGWYSDLVREQQLHLGVNLLLAFDLRHLK